MNVDQKKSYHESAPMNSHEVIPIIELVCNRCQSHGECNRLQDPASILLYTTALGFCVPVKPALSFYCPGVP